MTSERSRRRTHLVAATVFVAALRFPGLAGAVSCQQPYPTCPLPSISNPDVVTTSCGDLNNPSFAFASNKYYKLNDTSCTLTRSCS
jgi:hypothetical protein